MTQIEANAEQAREIWTLVASGTCTPDEATRKVLGVRPSTPAVTVTPKPKPQRNTMPAAKQQLAAWLEDRTDVVYEYSFHPTRKWRFDWYLPDYKIAVEYEGFLTKGANVGHASISGIMRYLAKYNAATEMGIRVFRAHAENIRTGEFFEMMNRVLGDVQ
jgi:hypothetical protein